ncbi:class I SAM-dependent methyltransferase [uncultured Flavobacterium sp.]|uniref:class I SAM-dependent methyltransferase n=1 Tax=uncultured Flavobacterium sp. TaxID=165435 RepID=UPI0030EE396F|tara:strand:- start:36848 stop:37561 length:714 start_codon:yes stop_codon:yes gene_type:complete
METKEIDLEGLEILNVIEKANKFNNWMYETIKPHCKGKILEIGSGIGNISEYFVKDKQDIVLSDLRDNYIEIAKKKFPNDVIKIDLVDENFDKKYSSLLGTFDTVFALNVVEHIKDDVQAIANCKKLLKKGGHLIILVPAYQSLFNQFDVELEHYRRYTQKSLKKIIIENQLTIKKTFSFNLIGILGWFVTGSVLKKKSIPEGQMGLFNKLVPIFKLADVLTFRKIGLSVICFAVKE